MVNHRNWIDPREKKHPSSSWRQGLAPSGRVRHFQTAQGRALPRALLPRSPAAFTLVLACFLAMGPGGRAEALVKPQLDPDRDEAELSYGPSSPGSQLLSNFGSHRNSSAFDAGAKGCKAPSLEAKSRFSEPEMLSSGASFSPGSFSPSVFACDAEGEGSTLRGASALVKWKVVEERSAPFAGGGLLLASAGEHLVPGGDLSDAEDDTRVLDVAELTNVPSLKRILRSSHELQLTAEHWRSLGVDIEQRLVEVGSDRKEAFGPRARALQALALLESEEGRLLCLSLADSEETPARMRAAAIEVLARSYPVVDVRPRALSLVESTDPVVRAAAKRALRAIEERE